MGVTVSWVNPLLSRQKPFHFPNHLPSLYESRIFWKLPEELRDGKRSYCNSGQQNRHVLPPRRTISSIFVFDRVPASLSAPILVALQELAYLLLVVFFSLVRWTFLFQAGRRFGAKSKIHVKRATKVMTPASMYSLWKQGSWLLWPTVHFCRSLHPRFQLLHLPTWHA